MKIRIQGLLYKDEKGNIEGAMSPVFFIKDMSKLLKFKVHGLVRVWFDNEEVHNIYEDGYKKGLTGHDTLIVLQRYKDIKDNQLMMFVDMGGRGCPVATMFMSDKKITMTPIYRKTKYEVKLTSDDIRKIFVLAFNSGQFEYKDKNETNEKQNYGLN